MKLSLQLDLHSEGNRARVCSSKKYFLLMQNADAYFYCQNFGSYYDNLNRGSPNDVTVEWCLFYLILFINVSGLVCKNFLSDNFVSIAQMYKFRCPKSTAVRSLIFL